MIIKITGQTPFQVNADNFTISPSTSSYVLQVSADGVSFSDLFTVPANTTRMVTGVANGSIYRLKNNTDEVSVNWVRSCGGNGGGGGSAEEAKELKPIDTLPASSVNGTVVATVDGIYQYSDGDWILVTGGSVDPRVIERIVDEKIQPVEERIDTVEEVTSKALNELNDKKLEEDRLKTINGESIVGEGDIEIQGGGSEPVIINIIENGGTYSTDMTAEDFEKAIATQNAVVVLGSSKFIPTSYTNYVISVETDNYKITIGRSYVNVWYQPVVRKQEAVGEYVYSSPDTFSDGRGDMVFGIVHLTQDEYDNLGNKDQNCLYIIRES